MLGHILRIFGFGSSASDGNGGTSANVASAQNGVNNPHHQIEGNNGIHPHAALGHGGHGNNAAVNGNGNGNELDDEEDDEDNHGMPMGRYTDFRRGSRARLPTFSRDHNEELYTTDFDVFDAEILERLNPALMVNNYTSDDDEEDDGNSQKRKEKNKSQKAKESITAVHATDFAARPIRPLPGTSNNQASSSARVLSDYPVPTVFPAHKKSLQFEYIRFLYRQGVFDLPRVDFTPQDADRLYTLRHTTFRRARDTPLLAAMMAAGAHQRYQRRMADASETLPCWTITKGAAPPTHEEIRKYIIKEEKRRYRAPTPALGYAYPASQRPELTSDFVQHRIQEHGVFGLEITHGVSDDQALDMIKVRDSTYIDPKFFVDGRWMYHTGDSRPVMPDGKRFYAFRHNELASERAPAPSDQTNVPGPSGSSSEAHRPNKGKKRAHEDAPEEENDGSTRRTRARHSGINSATTSTPGASSSSAPLPNASASSSRSHRHRSGRHTRGRHSATPSATASTSSSALVLHTPTGNASASSSRGKKRAHEDEQDEDENSTPAKKAKAAEVEEDYDSDVQEIEDPSWRTTSPPASSSRSLSHRSTRRTRARHSATSSAVISAPGASSALAIEVADSDVEEISDPRTLTAGASASTRLTRERHSTTSATATSAPENFSFATPPPNMSAIVVSSAASFFRVQKRARDNEEDEDSTLAKKARTTNAMSENAAPERLPWSFARQTVEEATAPEAGPSGTTHADTAASTTTPELDVDMDTEINTDSDTDSISSLTVEIGLPDDDDDDDHLPVHGPLERSDAFVIWDYSVDPKSVKFDFFKYF